MDLPQIFETTVIHPEIGMDARFILVPKKWLPEESTQDANYLLHALGLERVVEFPPETLLPVLTSVLFPTSSHLDGFEADIRRAAAMSPAAMRDTFGEDVTDFAVHMAFDDLLPLTGSAIDLHSLGKLLATSSGVGVGAYAGVVAAGGSPLILITVPLGMIIGGAAAGVANALEQGLRERVTELLSRRRGVQASRS